MTVSHYLQQYRIHPPKSCHLLSTQNFPQKAHQTKYLLPTQTASDLITSVKRTPQARCLASCRGNDWLIKHFHIFLECRGEGRLWLSWLAVVPFCL